MGRKEETINQDHHSRWSRDFSDVVHGEDLEFRESQDNTFEIKHLGVLEELLPPRLLSKLSAAQIITLSGAASGFLAGVIVCPLDVVKTRIQAKGAFADPKLKVKKIGIIQEFKNILLNEGVRGLYRGLVPITFGYLPTWTIYFTIYERSKQFYPAFLRQKFNTQNDTLEHFLSAITAGSVSSIAVSPVWVVKTRLMVQSAKRKSGSLDRAAELKNRTIYKGTFDAFRRMYKEEGIKVFYSGLIPSLFGLLHVGIHFPVYEELKEILGCNAQRGVNEPVSQKKKGLLWRLTLASSLSKMIASTVTYPHEILRTRMQIRDSNLPQGKDSRRLLKSISNIYKLEGFKGFYAGYAVNLARTIPASAVTLVSFEYFKTYLLDISHKL